MYSTSIETSPENNAGLLPPPYFVGTTLALIDEMKVRANKSRQNFEGEVLTQCQYFYASALLEADEPILLKWHLPEIHKLQDKISLFAEAAITPNDAATEVMVAYNLGNSLEIEAQKHLGDTGDSQQLTTLLAAKLLAGIETYTTIEKLKLMAEAGINHDEDNINPVLSAAVRKLIHSKNFEGARVLGSLFNFKKYARVACLYECAHAYASTPRFTKYTKADELTERRMIEYGFTEPSDIGFIQVMKKLLSKAAKIDSNGRITYKLQNAVDQIDRGRGVGHTAAYTTLRKSITRSQIHEHRIKNDENQKSSLYKSLTIEDAELNDKLYELTDRYAHHSIIDGKTNSGTAGGLLLLEATIIASRLVARRTNPSDGIDLTRLAALEASTAERQPTKEHYLMTDFYARRADQKSEQSLIGHATYEASQIKNPVTRLAILQRIGELVRDSFHSNEDQIKTLHSHIELTQKSLNTEFMQRILGVVIEPIQSQEQL